MNDIFVAIAIMAGLALVIRWGLRFVERHKDEQHDDSAGWP